MLYAFTLPAFYLRYGPRALPDKSKYTKKKTFSETCIPHTSRYCQMEKQCLKTDSSGTYFRLFPPRSFYKIACPLTCELTPPGTLAGVLEKKKVYRPCSLHFWASLSRSSISPRGMPHSARMYSWRWYGSCVGLKDLSVGSQKRPKRYLPSFESRSISRDGREIAVMEPVKNPLLLRQSCISLLGFTFTPSMRSQCKALSIFGRLEMILLNLTVISRSQ